MAKKLVAVTGIKHNGEFFPAGEPLDTGKFDKEELKQLHDAGAVKVEGEDDPTAEELAPEKSVNDGVNTAESKDDKKVEEKKEEAAKPSTTTSAPAKAAPAKATTPSK